MEATVIIALILLPAVSFPGTPLASDLAAQVVAGKEIPPGLGSAKGIRGDSSAIAEAEAMV